MPRLFLHRSRTSTPPGNSFSRGFTLIEIMLAVAILGIIMVMLAGSFHAVAAGKVQAENRLLTSRQARMLLAQITKELHGAVQTPLIASRVLLLGQGRMQNGAPLDSVTISTLSPAHRRGITGFGSEQMVSYRGQPNPRHRGWFMLMRQEQSALLEGTAGVALPPPVVIVPNVLEFHVRYFNGSIWIESWNSTSLPPGAQLPQAVAIDLVLAGAHGAPVHLSTQVMLPMAYVQW